MWDAGRKSPLNTFHVQCGDLASLYKHLQQLPTGLQDVALVSESGEEFIIRESTGDRSQNVGKSVYDEARAIAVLQRLAPALHERLERVPELGETADGRDELSLGVAEAIPAGLSTRRKRPLDEGAAAARARKHPAGASGSCSKQLVSS